LGFGFGFKKFNGSMVTVNGQRRYGIDDKNSIGGLLENFGIEHSRSCKNEVIAQS
jgi:hypothetical protein